MAQDTGHTQLLISRSCCLTVAVVLHWRRYRLVCKQHNECQDMKQHSRACRLRRRATFSGLVSTNEGQVITAPITDRG